MTFDRAKFGEFVSWALVVCAVISTVLVIRREFVSQVERQPVSTAEWKARYVGGWEDVFEFGIRWGVVDSSVQIVEFADFQCPYCAKFEVTAQAIRDQYSDRVSFTFAHLPLRFHEFSEPAARAAECADNQKRFDAIRSLLFESQKDFGVMPWNEFAKLAEVSDIGEFEACQGDVKSMHRVQQAKELAAKLGIRSTPAIIVNGWLLPVPPTKDALESIIANVLAGRAPTEDIDFFAMASTQ